MSARQIPPVPPMNIVVNLPYNPAGKKVQVNGGVYPLNVLREIVDKTEPRTCATCKWWELITTPDAAGVCLKMDSDELLSKSTMAVASAHDCACVLTMPTFSCNQWEAKE